MLVTMTVGVSMLFTVIVGTSMLVAVTVGVSMLVTMTVSVSMLVTMTGVEPTGVFCGNGWNRNLQSGMKFAILRYYSSCQDQ